MPTDETPPTVPRFEQTPEDRAKSFAEQTTVVKVGIVVFGGAAGILALLAVAFVIGLMYRAVEWVWS